MVRILTAFLLAVLMIAFLAIRVSAQCPSCPARSCQCASTGHCVCGPLCNCPGVLCQGQPVIVVRGTIVRHDAHGFPVQLAPPTPAAVFYHDARPMPFGPVVISGCPGGVCPR